MQFIWHLVAAWARNAEKRCHFTFLAAAPKQDLGYNDAHTHTLAHAHAPYSISSNDTHTHMHAFTLQGLMKRTTLHATALLRELSADEDWCWALSCRRSNDQNN